MNTFTIFAKVLLALKRKRILFLMLMLGAFGTNAQFAVTTNSGSGLAATYTSLANAITALNAATITSPVIITCPTGAETAPAGGYNITAQGTSTNTIIIQGNGSANSIITAGVGTSTTTDAIFKLIGADYVTIQGFSMLESAGNTTATQQVEWGVALLHASVTNGCQNNTIQNNTITLNKTNLNTFGIYSNNNHSATVIGTTESVTNNTTGPASNNKIYGNTISNVNMGIALIGTSTAANHDMGNDIGGSSSTTGNTISNWGGAATSSSYISNSGTSYCIYLNHQVGDNVSYNTITSAIISGTAVTLRGIFKDYSTAATLVGNTVITNNTITITDNFTSGTLECIRTQGTVASTSTLNISSNTILNTSVGGASSSTAIVGIVNSEAVGTLNMNSNIIRGTTSTATSGGFTGVSNTGSVVTTININNNQIGNASGNAITFSAATSGSVLGINNTGAASTCSVTLQNNDIRGIVHSVAGSSTHTYITSTGTPLNNNVNTNTFTNLVVNTTGSATLIAHSYSMPAGGSQIINNNSIVTGFSKTGAGGTVTCTSTGGSSPNGTTHATTNNNFSNITVTGATAIQGTLNNDGAGTSPQKTFTGNTYSNWTGGTSSIIGITYNYVGASTSSLSNNTFSNITGQGTVIAMNIGNTFAGATTLNVTSNTITNLTSTGTVGAVTGITCTNTSTTININNNAISTLASAGASAVTGISIGGATTTNVFKNRICDLSGSNASSSVNGILVSAGTTINLSNNRIGDLRTPVANAANPLIGISITGGTTVNTYFNTVYINGTSSGALFGSSAISASSTTNLTLNNNIFVNNSSVTGAGLAVTYRRSTTTLTTYGSTSNNNLFYTTGASYFTDGTNTDASFAAYKSRVSTRDASSVSENPNFLSTTCGNANFLKVNTTTATQIEGGGSPIAGITDDFDGDTRNVSTPDIGADEFTGLAADFTGPIIAYTALGNGCSGSFRTLTATISDPSGITNNGTVTPDYNTFPICGNGIVELGEQADDQNLTPNDGVSATCQLEPGTYNGKTPILYYNVNNGIYLPVVANYLGSNNYSWAIPAFTTGDVIKYYIAAQDNATSSNVSVSPSVGAAGLTASPPKASTPPTSPSSYNTVGSLSGTYLVGAGQVAPNYATLSAAIADYNTKCLSGNVVFSLTDASYTTTSDTIKVNANAGPSNTLTIKPTLANTTITGNSSAAVLVLNGADYVTIDGSIGNTVNSCCPASSASRDLTITNTNAGTSSAVVWLQTNGSDGATNNTIKNCNLVGSGVTQTLFGIGCGANSISTTSLGTGNNNNSYINNNLSGVQYGIYTQGASAANKNSGTIINQNIITTSANTKGGIWVGFDNGTQISCNQVSNIAQAASPDVFGISCGFGTTLGSTTSTGNDVTNATITKNIIGSVVHSGTFSAYGIGVSAATSGTTTIANNMISGVAGNGTSGDFSGGIVLGGGTGSTTNVYYNTVAMQGTITGSTAATQTSACLAVTTSTAPTLDLRNNIFSNTQVGNLGATLRFASIALGYSTYTTLTSNNNDLYAAGAGPGTYQIGITGTVVAGTNSTTLANWQTTSGKDAGSVNILPVFTSSSNLHLVPASNTSLNDLGTVVSVTDDIDCATRSATPDMGADEFAPPSCILTSAPIASGNTSFCNSGSATITATGYTASAGLGSSYQWYSSTNATDYPATGTAMSGQTNPSTVSTGTITTTTYYWLKVRCSAIPDSAYSNMITITINPKPSMAVTPSGTVSICTPSTQTLDASATNAASPSFQWLKNGAILSGETNSTYIPSSTGSYRVRIQNGVTGCFDTSGVVSITANPTPDAVTITPSSATICAGSSQALTASGGSLTFSGTSTLGSGTSVTTAATTTSALGPNPMQSYYGGSKQQMLITSTELLGLGMVNGSVINTIAFNMSAVESRTLLNYQVKMKNTTTSSFASTTFETGASVVRNAASVTPIVGWNTLALDAPFTWTGNNLLIEINFSNNDGGGSGTNTALYSNTSFASTLFFRVDNNTALSVDGATTASFTAYSTRNNMQIGHTGTAPASYTWSGSNLNTNTGSNVTVSPLSSTTYTVTSTINGCSSSNTAAITVNPLPTATPSVTSTNPMCTGSSATISVALTGSAPWSYDVFDGTNTINHFASSSPDVFTVNPSTTTTYTVTTILDNNNCLANGTNATTVNVNPLPTALVSGAASSCAGSSTNLSIAFTGTAPWTYSLNGAAAVTTSSNPELVSVNPTSTTSYTVMSISDVNCTGIASNTFTLNVNPLPTASISGTTTICNGDAAVLTVNLTGTGPWNFTIYKIVAGNVVGLFNTSSSTSTYTVSFSPTSTASYQLGNLSDANCTGSVSGSADITVNQPTITSTSHIDCDTYTWPVNSATYTTSGDYLHTYLNASSCVSSDTLHLTINHSTRDTLTVTACDAYNWASPLGDGMNYTSGGTFTHTSLNASNCVHTQTLILTINASTSGTTTTTECDTYTWAAPLGDGASYTSGGTYTHTSSNANNCTHTQTLVLTINASTSGTTTATACDAYTWAAPLGDGASHTSSGTYTHTTSNANGCVHTQTLVLTINASTSGTTTATACDNYTWSAPLGDGTTYTSGGTFTHTSLNANNCVHTQTLVLTINASTSGTTTATACDTYTWAAPLGDGTSYSSSGTYTHTSLNANNCVHTQTLVLTINASTSGATTATACDNYTWAGPLGNGTNYTTSGTYTHASMNANNCAHTQTLVLTINASTSGTTNATACNSYTWAAPLGDGATYTSGGTFTYTSLNANNCVNTQTLVLTINASTSGTTTATACNSYIWAAPLGDGATYTNGGTFTHSSLSASNCVHTQTLVLTINASTSGTTTATACNSYTWPAPLGDGATYTSGGTYTHTSLNANNCVHTQTLVLTINASTSGTTTASVCDAYTWAAPLGDGATYTLSGTYTHTSLNAANCVHTQTLALTVTPSSSHTSTVSVCDTYTWTVNGTTYTTSGTYSSVSGCHTEILNLTITPSTSNTTTASVCDSYLWSLNGVTYTATGVYSIVTGCHTEYLNVTITPSTTTNSTIAACGTYVWPANGVTYTTTGSYTYVNGCATYHLNLTINATTIFNQTVNALACYTWPANGASYSITGMYTYTTNNAITGCSETYNLNLTVTPGVKLNAKVLLAGSYDTTTNLMYDTLRVRNLIPATEPYTTSPYSKLFTANESASETVSSAVLGVSGHDAIVDWVYLELRNSTTPSTIQYTKRALVQRDGDIVSSDDGVSAVFFNNVPAGSYYVSVKHRNHLGVMSASPITFASCTNAVADFIGGAVYVSSGITTSPRKLISTGVNALWSADCNNNKNVKYNGLSNDKDVILISVGVGTPNNTISNVYRMEDANMDGKIRYNNADNDRMLIINNLGVNSPNNILFQHTPN